MVISRPVNHPKLSPRSELVKGQYESIEVIREVLQNGEESDKNPVEWIMVTRSDPGGGIPRFMVERGTPGGIVGDVSKFLDWAIKKGGDLPDQDNKKVEEEIKQANEKSEQAPSHQQQQANAHQGQAQQTGGDGGSGIFAAITGAVATGAMAVGSTVSEYMPATVSEYIPYFQQEHDSGSDSSYDNYSTADESTDPQPLTEAASRVISSPTANTVPSRHRVLPNPAAPSSHSTTSLASSSIQAPISNASRASTFIPEPASSIPSAATITQQLTHPSNSSERDLLKQSQKRIALDEKHAQKTADLNARAQQIAAIQNTSERAKAMERHEKDARKAQEKYEKEVRKTEEKRAKNAHKVEERKKAAVEKDAVAQANREVVDWRTRCLAAEREVEGLRRQVEGLQSQIAASGVVAGSAVGGGAGMPVHMRVG